MNASAVHTLFALTAAGLLATAAAAMPDEQVPTLTVPYSDLDLTTDGGVNTLRSRLRVASRLVCGDLDIRRLDLAGPVEACRDQAVTHAMAQMEVRVAAARSGRTFAQNQARSGPK